MIEFSASVASKGLPEFVNSFQDIDALINAFHEELKGRHLWQYYVLDTAREKESVKAALATKYMPWDGPKLAGKTIPELALIHKDSGKIEGLGKFASRFGVRVDGTLAAGFVKAAFINVQDAGGLVDSWVRIIDVVNVPLYEEWESDTKAAMENMRGRLKYLRLDDNGPKWGKISKEYVPPFSLSVHSFYSED